MKQEIFWKNPGYKARPELKKDIECDYLIVGGGVVGVSAAYFLTKFGAKNIVLIEKNYIAGGATGMAAGTLVLRGETDLLDLFKTHSHKEAISYWKGIQKGLNDIEEVIKTENIDCDAEPQDTLYCGFKYKSTVDLRKEYEAEKSIDSMAKFLEGDALKKELNTPLFTHGVLSKSHGLSVNPLKLTQGLSVAIEKYGVRIYENTAFLGADDNIAKTAHGNIRYKKIIVGIDADYPNDEIRTQKTTIGITRALTKKEVARTGLAIKKIVWNTKKNYDYFKLTKERRLLIGFGIRIVHEKHRKTEPYIAHLKKIEAFAKRLFPYLDLPLEYAWSGSFGVTRDYEPIIEFKGSKVSVSGAGSQVVCFMAAEHVVRKLLGKPSPMDKYF